MRHEARSAAQPLDVTLSGRFVRLEPLNGTDVEDLLAAACEDRSAYGFTTVPADLVAMHDYVHRVTAEAAGGTSLPFVVRWSDSHRVIGTTQFLDLGYWRVGNDGPSSYPSVAEIGSTWLASSAQRTAANTEAKVLMLDHAFGEWDSYRVCFQTDARNTRSRVAIERLGARFEGVRRAHKQGADGGARDTAWFSLLREEWPAARSVLSMRLDRS